MANHIALSEIEFSTQLNKASLAHMESQSIRERAQAALLLIQAGWDDKVVADVVGLPGLNAGVTTNA